MNVKPYTGELVTANDFHYLLPGYMILSRKVAAKTLSYLNEICM